MKQITVLSNSSFKGTINKSQVHKTFSQVFTEKKAAIKPNKVAMRPPELKASLMKSAIDKMTINHEKAMLSVKKAIHSQEHSPEKLLKIQYKTGALFLREQMYCRVAELFTTTIKNFTQMQV